MQTQGVQRGGGAGAKGFTSAKEESASDAGASPWRAGIDTWRRHRDRTVCGPVAQAVSLHKKVSFINNLLFFLLPSQIREDNYN